MIPSALRELAAVTEAFDDEGVEVSDVQTGDGSLIEDGQLEATIIVKVPVLAEVDLPETVSVSAGDDATVDEEGIRAKLDITIQTTESEPTGAQDTKNAERVRDADESEGSDDDSATARTGDESVSESAIRPVEADAGTNGASQAVGDAGSDDFYRGGSAASTTAEPADSKPRTERSYRDPERLREVYETCETFVEMRDALDANVTPQTVRHHMIKHGIHEPNESSSAAASDTESRDGAVPDDRNGTGGHDERESDAEAMAGSTSHGTEDDGGDGDTRREDAEESSETVIAVPGDLPDGVSVDDVRAAVESSKTLHQVRRTLGTDVEETRDILQRLNLLDLVTGRLATRPEDDPSGEEISERIRQATGD